MQGGDRVHKNQKTTGDYWSKTSPSVLLKKLEDKKTLDVTVALYVYQYVA